MMITIFLRMTTGKGEKLSVHQDATISHMLAEVKEALNPTHEGTYSPMQTTPSQTSTSKDVCLQPKISFPLKKQKSIITRFCMWLSKRNKLNRIH